MIEYFSFQAGTENPTFTAVLYTVLLAFLLSTIVAITYFFTTPRSEKTKDFFQALILSSIVASTVMQAIGDSLAIGLGMLGALAIIRFRTNLENPRDIIFMFATLAAGLACGVYGFVIASVGTVGFCLVAVLLRFTPLDQREGIPATVRLRIPGENPDSSGVEKVFANTCLSYRLENVRFRQQQEDAGPEEILSGDTAMVYNYSVRIKNVQAYHQLVQGILLLPDIQDLRINVNRENTTAIN